MRIDPADLARPLIKADPPVPVEVRHFADGEWYPGMLDYVRGGRVSVSYSRGPGMTHLLWVPVDDVRRRTATA